MLNLFRFFCSILIVLLIKVYMNTLKYFVFIYFFFLPASDKIQVLQKQPNINAYKVLEVLSEQTKGIYYLLYYTDSNFFTVFSEISQKKSCGENNEKNAYFGNEK